MENERQDERADEQTVGDEHTSVDGHAGELVDELLIEEISIDGMCGVY